jgi:glyoxylase-like metal-dependent hydrolase (beta-lactamase superfamily II)
VIRVSDGVYQLRAGGFVNAYLIEGAQDLTLVDTGTAPGAPELLEELRENGFNPKHIARVVLTHAHPSHAGGAAALLELNPVRFYAHPKELPVLQGKAPSRRRAGLAGLLMGSALGRPEECAPIASVQPAQSGTPLRGIPQWQLLHTPGHTPGSLSLYHPSRQILICGDVLSNRGERLHVPSSRRDSDKAALRASLAAIAKLDCDILCCGHGPVVRGGAFRHIEAVLKKLD